VSRHPLRLVIFDCDGVLIDSEPVSQNLARAEAAALGWTMTTAEMHGLTGHTWTALKPVFEARIGHALPTAWPKTLQDRVIAAMRGGVATIAGAREVLEATAALGLAYRIASNSSHDEMAQKFSATGLAPLVNGLTHSARDVANGKPAPDLFLAVAASAGVAPENCLVVEDSVPGMTAARAAGMHLVAYAPDGVALDCTVRPDLTIRSLLELPGIFASHMAAAA
jgi:beta-phosphoglucomutase-like phosphatase (HAD superfamily)